MEDFTAMIGIFNIIGPWLRIEIYMSRTVGCGVRVSRIVGFVDFGEVLRYRDWKFC